MNYSKSAPDVTVCVADSQRITAIKLLIPEQLRINDIDYLEIQYGYYDPIWNVLMLSWDCQYRRQWI